MTDKIASFYKREPINNGRQLNVDILKAVAILFMIICHSVLYLSYDTESFLYYFADSYLGAFLGGAPAFMICMGFGIIYSNKNDPLSLFKRGLKFLILAYVFNFFRNGIAALFYHDDFFISFLFVDILQFAGLALMAIALFKKLKLPSYVVLIIAIILSSISPLFYELDTGNVIYNSLINLFIANTEEYCGFAFITWFIFVVAGMWLGDTVKRVKNLDRFYLILMIISFVISLIANIYSFFDDMTELEFYGMNFFYALGYIFSQFLLLSIFHFLAKVLPNKILNICKISAKNMTIIYVFHWLIIGQLEFHMLYDTENGITVIQAYIFGLILWIVSYFFAILYSKIKENFKKKRKEVAAKDNAIS